MDSFKDNYYRDVITFQHYYFLERLWLTASEPDYNFLQRHFSLKWLGESIQECIIREKVFKNGPSVICGRQPLKNLKGCGLLQVDHNPSKLVKAVFHKISVGPFLNTLSHMLPHSRSILPSYRNQSIKLNYKSIKWSNSYALTLTLTCTYAFYYSETSE